MALEIRNRLQERAGVTVSLVTLIQGPSIGEFVGVLLENLDRSAPAAPVPDVAATPVNLQELSDESVDALLRQMLAQG
jgi:hypothetical protein